MCVVGDEDGDNISMKGAVHVGGQLMLYKRGTLPQQQVSTRNRHFILISLISLTGELLMCILIIAGTKLLDTTEMGIYQFKEMVGKGTDEDFIKNN